MEVESIPRPRDARKAMELLNRFAEKLPDYDSVKFNGGIFTIGASHTGDMYDVAMAHTIIGYSLVIIWGVDDSTAGKAAEIARFIDERETVLWTGGGPPPDDRYAATGPPELRALAAGKGDTRPYWIREGGATTIVTAYAGTSAENRRDVPGFVAPEVCLKDGTSLDEAISADLAAHGFTRGQKYVIVNYRESGHSGAGTAPPLDTGQEGFVQLLESVRDLGLVPVPMGEFDPSPHLGTGAKSGQGAHLLKYWTWKSVDTYGRRAEARLLRLLAERFGPVGAVGMRSGVTDLLAYVGVPTLSIDIHPLRGVRSKGWQRPLKRERVFPQYKIVSLLRERHREAEKQPGWPGAIAKDDLVAITKALDLLTRGGPADWTAHPHPQDVTGVPAMASDLRSEVTVRIEKLRRAAEYQPPNTSGGSGSGMSGMEALKREIEQEKAKGVSASQVAQHEKWLRDQRELIDHLVEWLTDSFVEQTTQVRRAVDDLRTARALL